MKPGASLTEECINRPRKGSTGGLYTDSKRAINDLGEQANQWGVALSLSLPSSSSMYCQSCTSMYNVRLCSVYAMYGTNKAT